MANELTNPVFQDADKARECILPNLSRTNVTEAQFLNPFDGAERAKLM